MASCLKFRSSPRVQGAISSCAAFRWGPLGHCQKINMIPPDQFNQSACQEFFNASALMSESLVSSSIIEDKWDDIVMSSLFFGPP